MLYPEHIMENAARIAVVRTDRLGDMVLTLPLCRALKEKYPRSKIAMICSAYTLPLIDNSPVLDEIYPMVNPDKEIRGVIRKGKFNVIFFPRPRLNESWAAFMEGVPLRIGSAYRWYSFLFNHRIYDHRKDAKYHEPEYNCRMAESVGSFKTEVALVPPVIDTSAQAFVDEYLKNILKRDKFIIMHPCSGGSARDWSADNFGKAAKTIYDNCNTDIILTGSANELKQCIEVQNYCPEAIILAGKLDLRQMIALISRSELLTANSTGVLHIAAALSKPVVGLYPNTPHLSAKRWGPYTDKSVILSPPMDSPNIDDMSRITPEVVAESVKEILAIY